MYRTHCSLLDIYRHIRYLLENSDIFLQLIQGKKISIKSDFFFSIMCHSEIRETERERGEEGEREKHRE